MRSGSDRRSLSPSSRRGRVQRGVNRSKSSDGAPPRPDGSSGSTRSTRTSGGSSRHRRASMAAHTTSGDASTRSTRSDTRSTRSMGGGERSTRSERSSRSIGGSGDGSQRSTRSSNVASFKQRSASGSPNNPRRRVSMIAGASPRQDPSTRSSRRPGSSNNLMGIAAGGSSEDRSSRRANRRASLQVNLGGNSHQRTKSTGNMNILADFSANSVSSQDSQKSSNNFQWQKGEGSSSFASPKVKQRTRNIPLRVKSLGAPTNAARRASMSTALAASGGFKMPPASASSASSASTSSLKEPPPTTTSASAASSTSTSSIPSLSPGRPSQFSTSSSKVARHFLEEDAEDTDTSSTKPLIRLDSKLQKVDAQSEYARAYQHDEMSEYSEAMSVLQPSINSAAVSDLEWNPEAQRQQQEEWKKFQLRGTEAKEKASHKTKKDKGGGTWDKRPDLREVDQTVNLMDASLGDYNVNLMAPSTSANSNRRGSYYSHQPDSHSKNKSRPLAPLREHSVTSTTSSYSGFFSQASTSLADYWRDEPSGTDSGSKKRRKNRKKHRKKHRRSYYRNNNCCQDLFCSGLTLFFLFAGALGALIAWKTGAFAKTNGAAPAPAPPVAATPKEAQEEAVEVHSGPMDDFQNMLIDLGVSTRASLATVNSPQYLAWYWITQALEDPTLLCVKPPEDDAELDDVLLEAYALAVLYYETNGYMAYNTTVMDHYKRSIWREHTNWVRPTPVCHWHGLECEGDRHIVHLNMSRNNLKGTFPQELKVLTDLRTMDFGQCGFAGTLPEDVWPSLTQLEYLWLHQNKLTGTMPTTFGNMSNLQSLRLSKNKLEGTLPLEINNMTSLRDLTLDNNGFDGTIPYLAHLTHLEKLELQYNKLEKHIPFEIFRFQQLKELRAEKNALTGTIPPEMQTMRELRILALDNNKMSGTLDDTYDHFDYLEELHLAHNQFTGTIPKSLGHLSLLRHLSLYSNQFSGPIPKELSSMTQLKEMLLYFNQFTGDLPQEVCDLKASHQLEYLALDCATRVGGCTQGDACCDQCM